MAQKVDGAGTSPSRCDKQVNPLSRLTIWLKITSQGAEVIKEEPHTPEPPCSGTGAAFQSAAGSDTSPSVNNDTCTTCKLAATDSFNRTKTSNMNSHNVNITNNYHHSCRSKPRKSRWSITTFVHHVVHHIVPPLPWFGSYCNHGSFSSWIPDYRNWWTHHSWPWNGWHC
ncbi:hypothetical protein L218DRAFT_114552 [Marasmius fiardii PR-910]|nr:hypothetical protein L218DRAFT_114552 [Marasmius fiardii PR-910]